MSKTSLKIFIFLALSLSAFVCFAVPAHAIDIANTRLITLDRNTLAKGFSVKSYDEKLWLPIFPGQYSSPVTVNVQTLSQGTLLPEGKVAVSQHYTYGINTGLAGFLPRPATLAIYYHSNTLASKAIYFYDKARRQWRELPSQVDFDRGLVRARTIFPYAQVVVLEDADADGLTAKSAIVADTAGNIIFEKNADQVRPIASLTKLVTVAVFLDNNPGWSKPVTIIESDNVGGASVPFEPGDITNVEDLFFATLVGSKNNATRALMRSTGLSEEVYINRMNQKVKDWGLTHTFFEEPTGLSEFNVSTAREMLEISKRVFNDFKFLQGTTVKWYEVHYSRNNQAKTFWVKNTNKLLDRDLYITGGKTGYTHEAGYNLITKAKNHRHELIALVLGAKISQNYEEVYQLLKKFL